MRLAGTRYITSKLEIATTRSRSGSDLAFTRTEKIRPQQLVVTVSSPSGNTTALPPPSPRLTPRHIATTLPSAYHSASTPTWNQMEFGLGGAPPVSMANTFCSPAIWVGLYFLCNMSLTLFNKTVLLSFPYPYILTGVHSTFCLVGTLCAWKAGYFTPRKLTLAQDVKLAGFSVLYTVNIALSNISLRLVTVAFHEVVRASSPLFTVVVTFLVLGRGSQSTLGISKAKMLTLIPIMMGVAIATYGDYSFSYVGLLFTLLGTLAAATKSVVTHILQRSEISTPIPLPVVSPPHSPSDDEHKREKAVDSFQAIKLHPLDLLLRMAPFAVVQCIAYAYLSGEMQRMSAREDLKLWDQGLIAMLGFNGSLAFAMNVVSLMANKTAGPLAMAVAANVKQDLTILAAVFMFSTPVSPLHSIGIGLTLLGAAIYGLV